MNVEALAQETLVRETQARLLSRRAELLRKHAVHLEEERELDAAREPDWPDRAAARNGEQVLHQQSEHESIELREIDAALSRIDDGTYGECEGCGEPIPGPRLVALPEARLCVACARKQHPSPA
jgi:RNA polymerase-binding protein DksA